MGKAVEQFKKRVYEATSLTNERGIPNVAAIAADSNGNILHSISSGSHGPHANDPTRSKTGKREKFTPDTVCWIASCTKLMTTVAVMQCVERGLLKLDDDVAETHLPEFKGIEVLQKMGDDGPVLKKATRKVTLRNLLTHTSGLAYEFTHPKLLAWRTWTLSTPNGRSNQRSSDIAVAHRVPLLFEPDMGWTYGYGVDWAGLAVMRATGQNLEEYFHEHIWAPLGMRSTTFDPWGTRKDLIPRMAGMTERDLENGNISDGSGGPFAKGAGLVLFSGGGGCCSTANDYIKLLSSLLHTKTSSQPTTRQHLLSQSSLDIMFNQTLGPEATSALHKNVFSPLAAGLAGNMPPGTKLSFGLGGLTNFSAVSAATERFERTNALRPDPIRSQTNFVARDANLINLLPKPDQTAKRKPSAQNPITSQTNFISRGSDLINLLPKTETASHGEPVARNPITSQTNVISKDADLISNSPSRGTNRAAGAMQWSGLPNCFWFISPEDGVCGCWFTQLLPPGDEMSLGLYEGFEKAVLEDLKNSKERGRL